MNIHEIVALPGSYDSVHFGFKLRVRIRRIGVPGRLLQQLQTGADIANTKSEKTPSPRTTSRFLTANRQTYALEYPHDPSTAHSK